MDKIKIVEASPENLQEFGMCGYKNPKVEGFQRKIKWTQDRMKEGALQSTRFGRKRYCWCN